MKEKKEKELLDIAIEVLKKNGWNVMVIGGINIIKRGGIKYNFTLGIDFTGKKSKRK